MQTTKRMLVAGLMAAAVLLVPTGLPGSAAHAAPIIEGTDTAPIGVGRETKQAAEAHTTGEKGAMSEAACQKWGELIDRIGEAMNNALQQGDRERTERLGDLFHGAVNDATDGGCFVIY
jgi:hypothetical protein